MIHKISIITPSYNEGQYLEHSILSVISQMYPMINISLLFQIISKLDNTEFKCLVKDYLEFRIISTDKENKI